MEQPQNGYMPGPRQQFQPALDDSTKYLLEKAKSVRSRPMWEPEAPSFERNQPQQQASQYQFERPEPYESRLQPRGPEDTTLSTKTRSLLDKVKESTAALQDMSSLDDFEDSARGAGSGNARRKQSRFLRRDNPSMERLNSTNHNNFDVGRMADEILGESVYPPNSASSRNDDRLNSRSNPTRKYSYQSSLDTDRFSDRSSPELRMPPQRKRHDDEDDLDNFISGLKQKTSGRDMYKIVKDIEGDGTEDLGRTFGRKSVSPIPQRKRDLYDPEPQPRGGPRGVSSSYMSSSIKPKYDPYEELRGGTGYNVEFERPSQDQNKSSYLGYGQQAQPQQPQGRYGYQPANAGVMGYDPYGGAGSMGMGYGQPQVRMQPQYGGGYGYGAPSMMQQQQQQPSMSSMQSMSMFQHATAAPPPSASGFSSRMSRRPPPSYGYYE